MLRRISIALLASTGFLFLACSSQKEAEIRIQDGKVCFTVPDEEFGFFTQELDYNGYVVSALADDGNSHAIVWRYFLEKGTIKKGECLVYGAFPKNATRGAVPKNIGPEFAQFVRDESSSPTPAPPLKLNTAYSVSLGVDGESYNANFCLINDDTGKVFLWNKEKNGTWEESCHPDPDYPTPTLP
jgi:hypothetical protein